MLVLMDTLNHNANGAFQTHSGLLPRKPSLPVDQMQPKSGAYGIAPSPSQSRTVRYAPSQQNGTLPMPLTPAQVISLVKEALATAREETRSVGVGNGSGDLKTGVTIELTRKNIQRIPEEVIDMIKDDIERIAFMHNQITTLPSKFAECTNLRYLNLRSNQLQEFPPAICQLTSLEILDLRSNKLKSLPLEIKNMSSLKVFSIQFNRIERLPVCMGEMTVLQCVKLEGNPISFPPLDIITLDPADRPPDVANENEIDAIVTARFKDYFRHYLTLEKPGNESGDSRYATETTSVEREGLIILSNESPKPPVANGRPLKRAVSGRFPVKISAGNASELPLDSRSHGMARMPHSATLAHGHNRGPSQHNATLRRLPSNSPSMIASNERIRSNSESISQANRNKRMGIVTRKTSDLGTVDETKSHRYSHFRGFSHNSAIHDRSSMASSNRQIGYPNEILAGSVARSRGENQVRRLSSLPEHRSQMLHSDVLLKATQGVLYSLHQMHPLVLNLFAVTRESPAKFGVLEQAFYGAASHLDDFDLCLYATSRLSVGAAQDQGSVQRERLLQVCFVSVASYYHVYSILKYYIPRIVVDGDPRYLRTLMISLYSGLVEARHALQGLLSLDVEGAILDATQTEAVKRPTTPTNHLGGIPERPPNETTPRPKPVQSDGISQILPVDASSSNQSSIAPSQQSSQPLNIEDLEEERLFEKIFVKLNKAIEIALEALPAAELWFTKVIEVCRKNSTRPEILQLWDTLKARCSDAIADARRLKETLEETGTRGGEFRNQKDFWQLCNTFVKAFVDMAMKVKEAKHLDLVPLSLLQALRPVQKAVKAVSLLIENSPWKFLAAPQTPPPSSKLPSSAHAPAQSSSSVNSSIPTIAHVISPQAGSVHENANTSVPATPLSAALGPAAQATVPLGTTQTRQNTTFSGNVFERADSLLSSQSRIYTMTNNDGHGSSNNGIHYNTTRIHGRSFGTNH